MRPLVYVLLATGACGRLDFGAAEDPDDMIPSNGVDAALVAGTSAITIDSTVSFDTDTGAITGGLTRAAGSGVIAGIAFVPTTSIGEPLGVFAFAQLAITSAGVVQLTGSRAAVILVESTLDVDGMIDASASCQGTAQQCAGPGGGAGSIYMALAGGCGPGGDGVSDVATGADSGGGGGGGDGAGANGGTEVAATKSFLGGSGGAPCFAPTLEPLVGGGGGGGGGPGSGIATFGGGGGGGVQLTALLALEVSGVIDAGGAGGEPGPIDVNNGGAPGGGGAGGAILLESPSVQVTGVVAANGGGGGGGCDHLAAGQPGQDGQPTLAPAIGGASGGSAGGGGDGAAASIAPTVGGDSNDANAGAGGGGIGAIVIRAAGSPTLAGTVSPAASVLAIRTQ